MRRRHIFFSAAFPIFLIGATALYMPTEPLCERQEGREISPCYEIEGADSTTLASLLNS